MKIAQVARLYESVPPKLYGGTERVVSYLAEKLVRLGHDVTLFANSDSSTVASALGIESNPPRVLFRRVELPKSLRKIEIANLPVRDASMGIVLERAEQSVGVKVRKSANIEIISIK